MGKLDKTGHKASIFEVGPRDGLQNEKGLIALADKIRLVDLLSACGFGKIEVASFVHPDWVPQMRDSEAVISGISRRAGVCYTALTPNMKGYHRALACACDEVAVFTTASESFSQRNTNCSVRESLERFVPLLKQAARDEIPVRAYLSCVGSCPYEGLIAPEATADLSARLLDMGCYQISLGDTIGTASQDTIRHLLDAVLRVASADYFAGHYHDNRHQALDNIGVSLDYGLRVFDSAMGGLGGCPYADGAGGNVATLAVADYLAGRGFECGLDRRAMQEAHCFALTLKDSAGDREHVL